NGAKSKLDVLNQFWTDFKSNVDDTKEIKVSDVIDKLNETVGKFLFMTAEGESRECPECKQGTLSLKIGKFGSFIGCSRYPECNYVRRLDSVSEDQKEGDGAMLSAAEYPKLLGKDSADNVSVFLKKGPYGFYVEKSIEAAEETKSKSSKKAKPKVLRSSLPADIPPEQVTLEKALFLLSLPKVIGRFEGEDVKIGIGRFGPYVTSKGIFASIPKSKNIADVTQEDAISLLTAKIAKSASKLKKAQ
ncbi:MAG: topoisomerase DNA-binding C4 zinc finger domain-containing protein, partial [Alphaproteobacteria bacterium]|nr:topoisomerase DNA-binding C4 zinc finger domain-containing protein [Alphaproteobacteria bacterium]